MVEMAPPDVAGALAAGAIDAFSMGEPFPSQAELGGYGRILFQAREYWPDYMSCILVVQQSLDRQAARCGAGTGGRHRALGPVAGQG
jgi:NitT/TauT family transport system substrate-binding protein